MAITTRNIKDLLVENFDLELEAESISDDSAIVGHGLGLDSVDALELLSHLNQKFGTKIKAWQVDQEHLASIAALTQFVNSVLESKK